MAMVVKTNMASVKTLNQLNQNNSELSQSLKKVSSGMRINGVGDDASGFSISEKMRAQIRGLKQCGTNTSTGHDLLNIASQAVDNQINITAHLREIAMKASDDTYSQADRDVLQSEASQMLMQLNDISWETNYNGIRLLDGVTDKSIVEQKIVATPGVFNSVGAANPNTTLSNLFLPGSDPSYLARNSYAPGYDPTLVGYMPADSGGRTYITSLDFSRSGAAVPTDFDNQGFSVLCHDCPQYISFTFTTSLPLNEGQRYDSTSASCAYFIGIGGAQTYDEIENAIYEGVIYANRNSPRTPSSADTVILRNHNTTVTKDNNGNISIIQYDNPPVYYQGTKGSVSPSPSYKIEEKLIPARFPYKDLYIQSDTPSSQNTRLQLFNTTLDALFPPTNTRFTLDPSKGDYPTEFSSDYANLPSITAKEQKWRDEVWFYPKAGAVASGSCVRTKEAAYKFLDDVDQALKYLIHVNTSLGAQINRLDNANNNLTTITENTTAAESTIRDADMAKEMANYTKHNVLTQAAQSMLSQANQNLGSSLDLLK